ncbi:hypothetical protein SI859A1_02777 [Aurantimonas manganoxydans SI85-9A1]|uniref:Uncharacterized protein n=1 Tax=Aurantimonas manganoxydans (strain ATCC BAA-1229 / DSM 21871 / SI85-9A1) TaxID=287752 RepID=Q1YGQ0_AURMS|nr:hypothetical protein SI859A1_02777 [Aurantimonas manganoxydans SI85-9A1]
MQSWFRNADLQEPEAFARGAYDQPDDILITRSSWPAQSPPMIGPGPPETPRRDTAAATGAPGQAVPSGLTEPKGRSSRMWVRTPTKARANPRRRSSTSSSSGTRISVPSSLRTAKAIRSRFWLSTRTAAMRETLSSVPSAGMSKRNSPPTLPAAARTQSAKSNSVRSCMSSASSNSTALKLSPSTSGTATVCSAICMAPPLNPFVPCRRWSRGETAELWQALSADAGHPACLYRD